MGSFRFGSGSSEDFAGSSPRQPSAKPLLGMRRQPGRLALAVFRLPLPLYRQGWGRILGHAFLLLVHTQDGRPASATPRSRWS